MAPHRARRNVLFTLGFGSLGASLTLIGYLAYAWHTEQLAQRNRDLFESLVPAEALRLERWKGERAADLAHYALSPASRRALAGLASGGHDAAAKAKDWFALALRGHREYARVDVFSSSGALLWSGVRPGSESLAPSKFPKRPPPDDEVAFSELSVESGRPMTLAFARSGPLLIAFKTDISYGVLPSLSSGSPPAPGGLDLYLARRRGDGIEVADHEPERLGATKVFQLPADSAVGKALAGGTMAAGQDHFGRTVFAMPARSLWLGWTPVAAREVGKAWSDSRLLAGVFGTLGALAVAGAFFLISRLMRSAEEESTAADERLAQLTRLHDALRVCAAASRMARTRPELAAEICRALGETGAFKFVVFWEPVAGDRLAPYASGGLLPGTTLPPSIPAHPASEAERSSAAAAFVSGRTVVVDDFAVDENVPLCRAFGAAQGVRSAMAVPLSDAGAGDVLVVSSPSPAFFEGEARSVVASIAAYFATACGAFAAAERSLRVDAELAKNRRLLEHVATTLPLGIFILDTKTRETVFATPALAAILEAPLDAAHRFGPSFVLGRLHPDDVADYSAFLESLAEASDGEVVQAATRLKSKEAGWKHVRVRGVVFERSAAGEPTLILGTLEDVTESVKSEEALEASWKDYRRVLQAVECAAEAIIITDDKGVIQYVNPAFGSVTGYLKEEVVGRHTRALKSGVHPAEFYSALWRTISSGHTWVGHLVNKRKDGTLYEEDASIAPVKDEHGKITNFVAVKKDVTKERSLENQLLQSQKLEAVGRLAGGIAHDFNNILTAILGYAHLGQQDLPPGSALRDDLAEIEKGARRAADLTRQLLIFSRKQVIKPVVLDPALVVTGLQKMLRRIVGEDVRLHFVSESRGARILADPGQLEQVILNFVVNSRDAMPGGGEVEVAVREALVVEPVAGVDGSILPGDYVTLSVRDTGRGIPPNVLPRIFEPFFTTKPPGEGTGLGLSTVYGIVKQSGAYLAVESAPGAGTVMRVYWPVAEGADAADEAPQAPPAPGRGERVLLVEDEPAVLALTRRLLEKAGYAVTGFPEAAAALAWADGAAHDILLTDVVLPGKMSGKDLADALLAKRPGAPVLFTSGYSENAISKHGVLDPGTRLLAKPFTEDSLLRAVRAALDRA
ncbi:PAS domain S-box protein [bacterium]|nr:MAG: PAS domain S-box protein [bacterium]